jgi:hypothetical protein
VHVRAKDRDGRIDEDLGVVPFAEQLRGDVRANTIMKAVTKAKRRVTLSISGLGWLDETEVETIPGAKPQPVPLRPAEHVDQDTGEITQTAAPDQAASPGVVEAASPSDTPGGGAALSIEDMAREAASRGADAMRVFWRNRTDAEQRQINKIRAELNQLVDNAEAQNG